MRKLRPALHYEEFSRRLQPRMAELAAAVFRQNRGTIRVKKKQVAVRNLEKIFSAVLVLGGTKGFHAMSLRELSRASGLSMGALYSYFGSKEELRGYLLDYAGELADQVVRAEAERYRRPSDRLAAAVRAHLFLSEALRPWFYFAYMEARNLPVKERRQAMANERRTEAIFAEILSALDAPQVGLTAAALKALLQDWYLKRWKYGQAGVTVEEYADFVLNLITGAIASRRKERKRCQS